VNVAIDKSGLELYRSMLQIGQSLPNNADGLPEVRIALLADHAPQQLAKVLSCAVLEQGLFPLLCVADYGTAAFQAFDPASETHTFRPEFVVYSTAMQKYRDRFFAAERAQERDTLPKRYLDEVLGVADSFLDRGIGTIVNNFPLPLERMFGNFGLLTSQSLYGSVFRFNQLLVEAIAKRANCLLSDFMYLANGAGVQNFFDERLWQTSKYPCANRFLPDLARSAARLIATRRGKVSKVLVLDLDNTLWGGVIGDDGLEGINLGGDAYGEAFRQFQKYILSLRDRGYILAVCSKNNESVALDAFRNHPEMVIKETDISVFVANWNDKASNIEFIARVLNLGLDSIIFIDDSAFERSLVRSALPQVCVPELPEDVTDYCAALEQSGLLEGTGFTKEDATRSAKYREEAQRTTEQLKFGNIDEYLASLEMRIDCSPFRSEDMPRIAQLIQRSNQFNFRTQRLSQAACEKALEAGEVTISARLRDKFGDYGLIAAAVCETLDDDLFIKEFVMSCRVLKRGVEEYLVNYVFDQCRTQGLKGVRGQYLRSAKNAMVADFYARFEFENTFRDNDRSDWYLSVENYKVRSTQIGEAKIDRSRGIE
jgi:FkbH-like protein